MEQEIRNRKIREDGKRMRKLLVPPPADELRKWNTWKQEQVKAAPARRRLELRKLLDDIRDDRGHSIGLTADELRRVKEIMGMGTEPKKRKHGRRKRG